jgi:hypothetical protein
MGIRTYIAIGLGFMITLGAKAGTNSWIAGGSSFWDTGSDWSLSSAPSITDFADFITNATTKAVSIDQADTLDFASELTISNLTVTASGSSTNTLNLTNMNAGARIPLNVLNGLTIGSGAKLEIDNSMLQTYNCMITNGSTLVFALGNNSSPVVVSNNLTLGGTLHVTDSGGFTNASSYTLFTYGGTLTYSVLAVASMPTNTTCVVSTNIIGQVDLVVTVIPPSLLPFQIISILRSTNDITVTWTTGAAGTDHVQAGNGDANGSFDTNNFADIDEINVSANTTNSYTDIGGATNMPSRFYRIYFPH